MAVRELEVENQRHAERIAAADGGTLMFEASTDIVAQAKAVSAQILGVPEAEIAFSDGLDACCST